MQTPPPDAPRQASVGRLGLRANLGQFALLVGVNGLVGGLVGQERGLLPLLARQVFGVRAFTTTLTFLVAFGATKAVVNLLAGTLSDRFGRKPVLLAGWICGLAVSPMLMWAPTWGWIVVANVLLGVNQGLAWSTTVIMKIDLVGPRRRGLAMGLNEAAGYSAVAATAVAAGIIAGRFGLRPEPFFLGLAFAGTGLALSAIFVRETREFALLEPPPGGAGLLSELSPAQVFLRTSVRDPALFACSQAGLINNLNDAVAWGLFPLFFAAHGVSVEGVAALAAIYPAVWGVGQVATGALSDRIGRKWLVVAGMWVQAGAIGLVAEAGGPGGWLVGSAVLGAGTAMVYPTLLAAVGDLAHPAWRASAIGVYRFWRDAGFAVGGLAAGVLADLFGPRAAIRATAIITLASGFVVAALLRETHEH
jgi:MFS family permease